MVWDLFMVDFFVTSTRAESIILVTVRLDNRGVCVEKGKRGPTLFTGEDLDTSKSCDIRKGEIIHWETYAITGGITGVEGLPSGEAWVAKNSNSPN